MKPTVRDEVVYEEYWLKDGKGHHAILEKKIQKIQIKFGTYSAITIFTLPYYHVDNTLC